VAKYPDEKAIFWVNLRQEPVVYINGAPYTAREPDRWEKDEDGCSGERRGNS